MTFHAHKANAPKQPRPIRNPACLKLQLHAAALPAESAGYARILETLGLGCGIVAVVGVLPLVMLLHR